MPLALTLRSNHAMLNQAAKYEQRQHPNTDNAGGVVAGTEEDHEQDQDDGPRFEHKGTSKNSPFSGVVDLESG